MSQLSKPVTYVTFFAKSAIAGLALAFIILMIRPNLMDRTDQASQDQANFTSFSGAAAKVSPAVVNIYANKIVTERKLALIDNPLIRRITGLQGITIPQKRLQQSLGSAVIIDASGILLTNHHVIEGASDIRVVLADSREAQATIVGVDPDTDLAVLKIELNNLPAAPLATSSTTRVGDIVLAVGNPFGIGQTVTMGIISARARGSLSQAPLAEFLQTDASIHEGNSGGALVNTRGEVVGINTATLSGTEGNSSIGFAIPAELALDVAKEVLQHGQVRRGWLGLDARALEEKDISNPGLLITAMKPDGPSANAGLLPGDILLSVNNTPLLSARQLLLLVAMQKPGDKVKLEFIRGNQLQNTEALLSQRPLSQRGY